MDFVLTEVVGASVQNQDVGVYYHAGQILKDETEFSSELSL